MLPTGHITLCFPKGPEKMLECGCTATVAVVQGRRLLLGDVGDSQAVLGSCEDESRGLFGAEVVTERHCGRNMQEAARIRTGFSRCTQILEDGYVKVCSLLPACKGMFLSFFCTLHA